MNNFFVSFNAVMPLAVYIIIGMCIKRFQLVDETTLEKFNSLLFKVFYPIIVFSNIYRTDFAVSADFHLLFFNLGFIIVTTVLLMLIVPRLVSDKPTRGVLVQAGFRSNIMLFGIPLTVSIFGAENTGTVGIVAAFIVPLYNILGVIVLEYFRGEHVTPKTMFISVLKNPLIQGAAVGVVYNLLKLPNPVFLQETITSLASSTTVFALIILGASLHFSSLKENMKVLVSGIALRLIIVPAVAVAFAYFVMGFRGMALFVSLIVAAAPMSTSAYPMTRNMGGNHELCAQYIAISTVLSVFTLFVWLTVLLNLNLI